MTRFFLGGGRKRDEPIPDSFFDMLCEAVRGIPQPIHVLLVMFARSEDRWKDMVADDTKNFAKIRPSTECHLEAAHADPDVFQEQIKTADVLYVHGGDTQLLLEMIKTIPRFAELLDGKVYIGASAGANLVSKYFYSPRRNVVGEGLGIVPIKCLPHWDESQQPYLEELKKYGKDLPIVTLREWEYKIF